MKTMAWIKRVLGFDVLDRATALEKRKRHNQNSTDGAIAAFKQFAKENPRD